MTTHINSSELLLREIHLPDTVLWWPPALGWWLLIILIIVGVMLLTLYKKTLYSRKLKKNIGIELKQCNKDFIQSGDKVFYIRQLSSLLRRVSLKIFKHENIAGLNGENWIAFLKKNSPRNCVLFTDNVAQLFIMGPYQCEIKEDVSAVYEHVSKWVNYNIKKISRFT